MIFKIAWRNIYRNKKRSLITITSIFAALFLIIFMRALQFGFYDNLIKTVVESYAGYVEVHAKGFWDNQNLENSMVVDNELIKNIESVNGVENTVERPLYRIFYSINRFNIFDEFIINNHRIL